MPGREVISPVTNNRMAPLSSSQVYGGAKIVARVPIARVTRLAPSFVPSWLHEETTYSIVVVYSGIFLLILFVAWLSNREVSRSLRRAQASKKLLEDERDTLEHRIAERTEELVTLAEKRADGLRHAAQFGKLSQGLVHDLISPLSSISLYTERLIACRDQPQEYSDILAKMIVVSRRMNSFMENTKSYIGKGHLYSGDRISDIVREVEIVKDILSYKARMTGVSILVQAPQSLTIQANPLRIHQLLLNLVSNAIESYETIDAARREDASVNIVLKTEGASIIISVTDSGAGISPENRALIFKSPFTTKINGTGTGLMTIRTIVEEDLHGHISAEGRPHGGSIFAIVIPRDVDLRNFTYSSPSIQNDIHHPESFVSRSDTAEPPRG